MGSSIGDIKLNELRSLKAVPFLEAEDFTKYLS